MHTVYTHGNGLVIAYGNRRQFGGRPEWIVKASRPRASWATSRVAHLLRRVASTVHHRRTRAGRGPIEFDTPELQRRQVETSTPARVGSRSGDLFTRMLYAARNMDINLLLSDRVNSESRILYDRTPKERVAEVAPWLTVDSNVYPAIVDDRPSGSSTATPRRQLPEQPR